jgi:hypothetical protein
MTKSYLFDLLKKTWERDITADEALEAMEEEITEINMSEKYGEKFFNAIRIEDEQL